MKCATLFQLFTLTSGFFTSQTKTIKTHQIKFFGLIILLQILGTQSIQSQNQELKAKYKTWLVMAPEKMLEDLIPRENRPYAYQKLYEKTTTKANLYQLKDSSINVAYSLHPSKPNFSKELEIKNIDVIKVRRKGNVLRGALIGAVSGLVLGTIIGRASIDDSPPPCNDPNPLACAFAGIGHGLGETSKPSLGAFFGTLVGTGIGIAIGSIKVSIPINGKQSKYEEQKIRLQKYLIR